VNDLQIARDLRSAADYLRTHGWWQGSGRGPNGGVCVAQAICMATEGVANEHARFLGFREPTRAETENLWRDMKWADLPETLPGWNDQPGRTLEEVLARLEETALLLEVRAYASDQSSEVINEKELAVVSV
jgi:hypothetical protein